MAFFQVPEVITRAWTVFEVTDKGGSSNTGWYIWGSPVLIFY